MSTVTKTTVWEGLRRALSPVEERPRVVPDIEVARYTTRAGAPYVVLHNPARGAYARLDPREFDLLELMDGQHSVKELVIAYYQRHGVLALPRVAGLVHLLREQGFLADSGPNTYALLAARLRRAAARRLPTELTSERFDVVLGSWYRAWGHVFFSRAWLMVGLALGVLGPLLVLAEVARGRYVLFQLAGSLLLSVVLLVALALVTLAVHELGHGLAVKHAGRRVHRAGVRLYYGLPAAYVDTTDVWMAPPHLRLVTAFAGPWTGLVLGGSCAVASALVPAGPGTFLFTAAFVFLLDNLFNFNPLLELDGYYMLVDLLDKPLLRPRALAFVRGPLWRKLWRREALSGDERLFAVFGLGSAIYAVVAIVLAVRGWQGLILPLVQSAWASAELVARLAALLLAGVIAVPVGVWIWVAARRLLPPTTAGLAWLSGRAAARRYREALDTLRAVPGWSDLPQARLLEVARAMRPTDVAPGDEVVRQGEPGQRFYLIARGAFEVLVDDQPQVRLNRGDYFGERALLYGAPRAATVVAVERGRLFMLDQAAFDALLASDVAARARLEAALAYRAEVAGMPLFRDLAPAELDLLLARLVPVSAEPGTPIIRQGEPGHRFYVVRAGLVEVIRDGQPLARLGPGEAFGEIALLFDMPRTATVVAVEPTELLALEASDFRDLLAGYLGRAGELERLSHLRLSSHKRLDELV